MTDYDNGDDNKNNRYNTSLLILLVVVLTSMIGGILLPTIGRLISPYLLVLLGILLFLNLIKLELADLVSALAKPIRILILSVMKIAVIPLALYAITNAFYPSESLSVLLLSGISTGLGAPFVVNFVGGPVGRKRLHLVVGMILITSLLVPFSLPSLVYWLFHRHFAIPFSNMIILLSAALFVPLGLGWLTRKYIPKMAMRIDKRSLPLSMVIIALINFGMFARFSSYFYTDVSFVITTILLSVLFFVIYGLSGYGIERILSFIFKVKKSSAIFNSSVDIRHDFVSSFVSMSYINNILVAVFAEQFFGPKVAALAAFYNVPYYIGIFFLKNAENQSVKESEL
jgi:bile acid:Na+ symporter, BASS family